MNEIEHLTTVFDDQTSFRARGFAGRFANRNFTSVFRRLNLISCERVAPGQEKSQFKDVKMRRWADVRMRRCEDVKMRRCEDEQM